MPSFFDALKDAEYRKAVIQGLLDSANRGMVATTLGAPVDAATSAVNLGIAGAGYLGHKSGLMRNPMELIDPASVPGSSEWIGGKMQNAGMVTPNRNPIAEAGFSMLAPVAGMGAQKVGGAIARADLAMAQNAANAKAIPRAGQRGVIAFPDGITRPEKSAQIKSMAEDAASKLRELGFSVDLQHSGSAMGPSSYIRVSDPETGRFITDPLRISDHSKGPFNSQFVHDAGGPDDIQAFIESALAMRAKGPSESVLSMAAQQASHQDKVRQSWMAVYERASKKQAQGEPLSNKERQSIEWVKKNN